MTPEEYWRDHRKHYRLKDLPAMRLAFSLGALFAAPIPPEDALETIDEVEAFGRRAVETLREMRPDEMNATLMKDSTQ